MTTPTPPEEAIAAFKAASEEQLIAALELMYIVAKADGFVAADELRQLLGIARASGHQAVDSHRLSGLISSWRQRAPTDAEERIAALGVVLETPELKRAAYELAAKTVTIDRELSKGELEVINLMSDTLGLT